MTMPFYASVDQLMRDRSELARKGIARGRSNVVLSCADGVLFVAENRSNSLRKFSEIYDKLGFAAVGRYNEFENLRRAGIRWADIQGYSYDRRDVSGRSLANLYAQVLGASFVEQQKPVEVELCIAGLGATPDRDQLFRVTYDGSITDEPRFVVMGGTTEPISAALRESYEEDLALRDALRIAVEALQAQNGSATSAAGSSGEDRALGAEALEVALLDRSRARRSFRRLSGAALTELLPGTASADDGDGSAVGTDDTTAEGADSTGAGDEVSGAGGADPSA